MACCEHKKIEVMIRAI